MVLLPTLVLLIVFALVYDARQNTVNEKLKDTLIRVVEREYTLDGECAALPLTLTTERLSVALRIQQRLRQDKGLQELVCASNPLEPLPTPSPAEGVLVALDHTLSSLVESFVRFIHRLSDFYIK